MNKTLAIITAFAICTMSVEAGSSIEVNEGDKIAFLGDSITQAGNRPGGYVHLVVDGLNHLELNVTHHGAGISGHKSNDMLRRVDRDVIEKKPDWMTLSCGVNDVWHNARGKGVNLPDYKTNIAEIVDRAQAAGIKVMILTSTMIQEDPEHKLNVNLAPYNDFLRELAKERNLLLADLNADMQARVKEHREKTGSKKNCLTSDGVHMNADGNRMMALGVLRAFKLSEEEIARVEDGWDNDTRAVAMRAHFSLSRNEEKAFKERSNNKHFQRELEAYLKKNREEIIKAVTAQ